jgi:hypothetical protein
VLNRPFWRFPARVGDKNQPSKRINPQSPGNETGGLRQGYTVRSATGYRYTTYVPYNTTTFAGNWLAALGDEELYDYNRDKWETTSFAAVANYSKVKAELRAVLLKQYVIVP